MRVNKVFLTGMVLFEPMLRGLYHYNMLGFLTDKERPNIVKISLTGTNAVQFCRQASTHSIIHIEGYLSSAKVPQREARRNYIAPLVRVESFSLLTEESRREYISVDFAKSVTALFAEAGINYDPKYARNVIAGGGNLMGAKG